VIEKKERLAELKDKIEEETINSNIDEDEYNMKLYKKYWEKDQNIKGAVF